MIDILRMSSLSSLSFDINPVSISMAREIALHPNLKTFASVDHINSLNIKRFLVNSGLTDLNTSKLTMCSDFYKYMINNSFLSNLSCQVPKELREDVINYDSIINLIVDGDDLSESSSSEGSDDSDDE